MLLHILLERGHFEKINFEINFMGLFHAAKEFNFDLNYCTLRYAFMPEHFVVDN